MTVELQTKDIKQLENRFLTLTELAEFYGISSKTLYRYLKPVKVLLKPCKRKRFYTPQEVKFIVEYLGNT